MGHGACVYILTNRRYGTLYVGATTNLPSRIWQHRTQVVTGFTQQHALKHLVWFEMHERLEEAFSRERQIKRWHRDWKINLVQTMNPDWVDLYDG